MSRIFLSYRREDSIATAGRLHDRLSKEFGEHRIFIDVDDIPAGVDFVEYIHEQVAMCDVLLAIIGPRWLKSIDASGVQRLTKIDDFVSIEIAAALKRDVRVIPTLVDGAQMPSFGDLPDILRPLATRNAVEIRNTQFHQDAGRLIQRIHEIAPSKGQGRKKLAILCAAALPLVMAASGGVYFLSTLRLFGTPSVTLPAGFNMSDFIELDRSRPPACEAEASAPPEPVPLAFEGHANLAMLKQARATASSVILGYPGRHRIRFVNDGWYNNCRSWIPASMPAWVEMDLGDLFFVSAVRLGSEHTAYWNDRAPTAFSVELRRDPDSPWTTVYMHGRNDTPVRETTTIRFLGQNAQFVRVNVTDSAAHDLPRIDELEVYGEHIK